jgi:hypothetical protein
MPRRLSRLFTAPENENLFGIIGPFPAEQRHEIFTTLNA